MMKLDQYEIFRQNKKTLKELSKDTSNPDGAVYMTESAREAVDFDKVKQVYTNRLGLSEESAASVDALLGSEDGIAFVEFKNGKVPNKGVKDKIRDSLLIFCGIVTKDISYTRKAVDFVLAYNLEKNPMPNQVKKDEVRESAEREKIAKHFLGKAGKELVRFDLEKYKTLYFREVHTYSGQEFEEYLKKTGCGHKKETVEGCKEE